MAGISKKTQRPLFWSLIFWGLFAYTVYVCIFYFVPYAKSVWIGAIAGVMALMFAAVKTHEITNSEQGTAKMAEIAAYIRKGTLGFLLHQYKILSVLSLFLFILIWKFINIQSAICFVCGAFCSALTIFAAAGILTKTNIKTAQGADISLNNVLKTAFGGAACAGMVFCGLGLLGLGVLFITFKDPDILSSFALGASLVALFIGINGGIYAKNLDIETSSEEKIKENAQSLEGLLANNIGNNVVNALGINAEIFESYTSSIIAAIILGAISLAFKGAILPLVISGFGIFASILAASFIRTKEKSNPAVSIPFAAASAVFLTLGASYFIIKLWMSMFFGIFWAIAAGALAGFLIKISTVFTGRNHVSNANAAFNVISELGVGLISTTTAVVIIIITAITAFWAVGGLENFVLGAYGIAMASLGMLFTFGIFAAINASAPIFADADKIAQMADLEKETKARTNKLNSTFAAIPRLAKSFAAGAFALTSLALLFAYINLSGTETIDLIDPRIFAGLFFGVCLPFFFAALGVGAIRRTFLKEAGRPNNICTPLLQGIFALAIPLFAGIFAGVQVLAAMLFGAITSGTCLAFMAANSDIATAAGGILKDILRPCVTILIKFMTIVSLVCVTLFIR